MIFPNWGKSGHGDCSRMGRGAGILDIRAESTECIVYVAGVVSRHLALQRRPTRVYVHTRWLARSTSTWPGSTALTGALAKVALCTWRLDGVQRDEKQREDRQMPRPHPQGLGESLLRNSLTEFVGTAMLLEDRLVEPEEDSPQSPRADAVTRIRRRCPSREGGMVWGVIGVLLLVSIYFTMTGQVQRLLNAVRDLGFFGAVVLVVVYSFCMVILVPGTILNVGAGFLYGTLGGYVVTIFGCMIGAVLCFALGRGVLQGWVRDKVAEHGPVARLCKLMGTSQMSPRETFTIVLVSRLPPVMPFALTNYAFSITDVSFPVYFFGTLLGVTPACLLDAYIGSLCDDLSAVLRSEAEDSDGSASGEMKTAKQFELVVGVVLTIFATTVLVVYGNRVYVRLQAQAERDDEQQRAQNLSLQEQQQQQQQQQQLEGTHGDQRPDVGSTMTSRPASPTGGDVQDHPSNVLAVPQVPAAAFAAAAPAAPTANTSSLRGME